MWEKLGCGRELARRVHGGAIASDAAALGANGELGVAGGADGVAAERRAACAASSTGADDAAGPAGWAVDSRGTVAAEGGGATTAGIASARRMTAREFVRIQRSTRRAKRADEAL